MSTDIERLVAVLEARTASFEKAMNRAVGISNQRARQIETRFAKMNRSLTSGFSGLGAGIAKAFAIAGSLRGVQSLIDRATRIQNALKIAGLAGDELTKVYDRLFDSAQRNAAPLETLVTLYGSAALVQKELNVSQEEMLNFTDKIALALRVAGTDAQSASGALLQLSQALGSGVVRAEEFNSILEGALPIAQAAAAGLEEAGGSVAKLRALVVDGKVSSEAFFRAFEAGSVILQEKVAGAELTAKQAFVRLQNTLVNAAGKFNEVTGASAETVRGLDRLAGIVNGLSNVFEAAANGPIGSFIEKLDQLNELIKSVLPGISAFGLLDEKVLNDVAGFIGPSQGPSSVPVNRAGKGGRVAADPIQSRIDAAFGTAGVKPVSLANFAVPEKEKKGRGGRGPRENDLEREIRQIQERTAAIQAETAALASLNPLIEDYGYAVDKARAKQELLTAAKKAGIAITPELEANIDKLAESYAQASVEAEKLAESQDRARQGAEELRDLGKDVMSSFIQDLRAGKSASEALANALQKVADKLLNIALDNLFSGGFGKGGLLGGFLIPGILHKGGVAGRDGYGHGRAVSPSVFAGAKRYHRGGIAGLQPGEVPAILQRGEVVLPKGARGASPGVLHVVVRAEEGDMFRPVIRTEAQGVAVQVSQTTIGQYDKSLPGRISDVMERNG